MKRDHLPITPGIYRIRNILNEKVYVGGAKNIRKRANGHREKLRGGTHQNNRLATAYAEHGESSFVFEVLELVIDVNTLFDREQFWIDKLDAFKSGYNCRPNARTQLGYKRTAESIERTAEAHRKRYTGFISPEGIRVSIIHMQGFCKETGCSPSSLLEMSQGKLLSVKGWTHENRPNLRRITGIPVSGLIDPNGNELPTIHDLKGFCKSVGIEVRRISFVIRGKVSSWRGWKIKKQLTPY